MGRTAFLIRFGKYSRCSVTIAPVQVTARNHVCSGQYGAKKFLLCGPIKSKLFPEYAGK
jgi:hypothetical protein